MTTTPADLLEICDELAGTPRMIKGMAFRQDGVTPAAAAASQLIVQVYASTAVTTGAAPNATFAANHGVDKTQVGSGVQLSWPATPTTALPSQPFAYQIPFSQPWAFGGAGPLCLEVQIVSRNNSAMRFDYALGASANPFPLTALSGTGCKATGINTNMALTASASANWPASSVSLVYAGSSLPKSAAVVLMLGIDNKQVGGIPLPFALPGTTGAPSGTCTIYNDSVIPLGFTTTATGTLTQNIGLTVNPFYNGASLFGQVVALDAAANAFGVVMSNGVVHHVVAPYTAPSMGVVYSNNSTVTGTTLPNQGYITWIDG